MAEYTCPATYRTRYWNKNEEYSIVCTASSSFLRFYGRLHILVYYRHLLYRALKQNIFHCGKGGCGEGTENTKYKEKINKSSHSFSHRFPVCMHRAVDNQCNKQYKVHLLNMQHVDKEYYLVSLLLLPLVLQLHSFLPLFSPTPDRRHAGQPLFLTPPSPSP